MQCKRPKFNPWVGKITWKRDLLLTVVFSAVEFHRQRSLAAYSPWSPKESDTAEQWENGHGLVGRRGSRWTAGECHPWLWGWFYTVNPFWHRQGYEMEDLHLLNPLGKMLQSRAWVGLAVRVPWKKVPSSDAHSWTLSSAVKKGINATHSYRQTRLHPLSFYHCVQGRAITCYWEFPMLLRISRILRGKQ